MNHERYTGMFRTAVLGTIKKVALGTARIALIVLVWSLVAARTISALVPEPIEVVRSIGDNFFNIPELQYIYYSSGGLLENLIYTMQNVITSVLLGSPAEWYLVLRLPVAAF